MGKGTSFLLGGVIGAAAALLLTPRTGAENRELLAEKIDYYSGHGEQIFHRATDDIRERVGGGVSEAQPVADDIRAKINEARDRIAEQITQVRDAAQPVEADVADVTEAAEDIASAAAEA